MTHARGSLGAMVGLAAASAGTGWVAIWSWRVFATEPGGFINPLMLLAIVVAGTGTACRWWRLPAPLILLVQVVVSGVITSLLLTGSPLPIGGAWTELHTSISQAVDSANQYAAPIPITAPEIDPLLILAGLACLLLIDFLACTLHRVPLAGLPLLVIYSLPVSMADGDISWWIFALTAAGFMLMLFLQESDQVSRWGRSIGEERDTGDPIAYGVGAHTVRTTATAVGGVATALAIVLPALIPTARVHVFDFGPGSGGGNDIRVDNPVADLVRDLKQGADTPLIRITTTDPNPSYLRILALTRFTDSEWTPGDRDVPTDQLADGAMPPPEGVAVDVPRTEVPYDVTVLPAFKSRWLPTQTPISRINAQGDWRYDTKTMDFLAGSDDLTTAGLHYTMTALDLGLTSARLEKSGTSNGKVSAAFTDLPSDLPGMVRTLAADVTRNATTNFDKAVALQDWFREDGGFTYSLQTKPGSGSNALVSFLGTEPGGRTGYCEQFASAMAVMARTLGIPARVAIGFLSPTADGPNSWVYSARDMHAWPELYFDGAGWVRFEPTPAGRAQNVPNYTVPITGPTQGPTNPTAPRSSETSALPNNRPTESQDNAAAGTDQTNTGSGVPLAPVAGGAAAILLLAGGLLLPRLIRRRRRARRLTAGGPEEVWAELRDTAVDLAVPWPRDRSPRATRDGLVGYLGAPLDSGAVERPAHGPSIAPGAVAALDRIVSALERLRYARPDETGDRTALRADAQICRSALLGGAARSARRRAEWWPRSVVTFRTRSARSAQPTVEARYGGVIDHIG